MLTRADDGVIQAGALQLLLCSLLPEEDLHEGLSKLQ